MNDSPAGKGPAPTTVGAREAEHGLDALLDRVERGACFVITRGNRRVARLSPFDVAAHRAKVEAAFAVFDAIAAKARMSTEELVASVRSDRDRGHRP